MIKLQNRYSVLEDQILTEDEANTQTNTSNTRPNFDKALTKAYFKLIQTTHHLDIAETSVQTNTVPIGMSRQVRKLSQFIKPASPTDTTTNKITQNTLKWMQTNMVILTEHYTQKTIELMDTITKHSEPEWLVAVKWAKNRFKQKLKEQTILHCEHTIKTKQLQLSNIPSHPSYASVVDQHHNQVPQLAPPTSAAPIMTSSLKRKKITVQVQVHHREVSPIPLQEHTPKTNKTYLPDDPVCSVLPVTGAASGERERSSGDTATEPREIRMMGCIKEKTSRNRTQSESSSLESAVVVEPNGDSSLLSDDGPLGDMDLENKPNRHVNTDRKLTDWAIRIHKPIVFIGDSNLSRIPHVGVKSTQVDSFPGANFRHIEHILHKLEPHPLTQKVILAVGLNNKQQQPHKTAIKQLQGMWRTARTTFPNATIYTPVIHFSDYLPLQEQQNLKTINSYIASHGNPLLELNKLLFKVERDGIHWTATTAQRIFDSWCDQLNF